MCHCCGPVDELSERERERLLEAHSDEELRAEHTPEELEALGVSV